jgi:hypothetical protein
MRSLRLLGAIAGTVSLLAATAALGAGLKTAKETITLGTTFPASVTAECDRGRKALSGGFAGSSFVGTFLSAKQGKRAWTLEADGPSGETLTALAYCAKGGKRVQTSTSTTSLDSGEIDSVTAQCEAGAKAVSGGFDGEPAGVIGSSIATHESRRAGKRSWIVSAGNFPLSSAGDLTASVQCRKGKSLKGRSDTVTIEGESGGEAPTGTATAKCKPGTRAVSGGFSAQMDGTGSGIGARLVVYASQRSGPRKWIAQAANVRDEAGELTSYVYCEKKPKKK